MKRLISILLITSLLLSSFLLTSCGETGECDIKSFTKALEEVRDAVPDEDADTDEEEKDINSVTACIYGDGDKYYDVKVTDDFISLFSGDYAGSSFHGGEKLLSVTVSMQYEICFFEDDCAMIYYGFCGVLEKDRQYFSVKLDGGVDALREYILNNGIISDLSEEN